MKRWRLLAVALVMLLAAGIAGAEAAQTKPATIWLEGQEEEIVVTHFEGDKGYGLWYDAERLVPLPGDADAADLFVPIGGDADSNIKLSVLLADGQGTPLVDAVAAQEDALRALGYAVVALDVSDFLPGEGIAGLSALREEEIAECYLFETTQGVYVLTLTYPMEAAEGFGQRLFETVASFEMIPIQEK